MLEVRPSNEFSYDSAVRKLVDLDLDLYRDAQATLVVPGDDDPATNYRRGLEPGLSHIQGNIMQLSSAVNLESRLAIGCAGCILTYIHNRRAGLNLESDEAAGGIFKVTYLEMFGLADVM